MTGEVLAGLFMILWGMLMLAGWGWTAFTGRWRESPLGSGALLLIGAGFVVTGFCVFKNVLPSLPSGTLG